MIRPSTPSNQPQQSTPPRSTTFPTKPTHKPHISHHAHRVHHHHHNDRSVPQSAILPTTTSNPFGDFLSKTNSKIDGKSDGYKTPPRALEQQHEAEKEKKRDGETWKEVERLRVRRNAVDNDLRTRLSALSNLSTTTTRRLDYTYYSLLSSLSSLTSAISSLSTLSRQIASLQTQFTSSSSSLGSEITNQISSHDNSFDAQARRISQLETRIKKGRETVARLGERLDGVREKVEKSSSRDRESTRMFGRRLKLLWGFLGSIIGLFLILAMARQWRGNEYATRDEVMHLVHRTDGVFEKVVGFQENGQHERENQGYDDNLRPSTKTGIGVEETTLASSARSSVAADADAMLQLFDEL